MKKVHYCHQSDSIASVATIAQEAGKRSRLAAARTENDPKISQKYCGTLVI
jgi:hypothetical protein